MKTINRSIACGLLLVIGLAGCSGEGGASVPAGAGADAAANKSDDQPEKGKKKQSAGVSNAEN